MRLHSIFKTTSGVLNDVRCSKLLTTLRFDGTQNLLNLYKFQKFLKMLNITSRPVVLKVFLTFLPYRPKHCQFLPNKDHK